MSTDEYTPDDAAVRDYYRHRAWVCAVSETRLPLDFDRWLAAHDAEIRTERFAPEAEQVNWLEVLTYIDETLSANEGNSEAVVWRNDEVIAMLTDLRSRFAIPVQADTYRISYQKYLMATPGNFASVRDAVEDAFRAGWEAR